MKKITVAAMLPLVFHSVCLSEELEGQKENN